MADNGKNYYKRNQQRDSNKNFNGQAYKSQKGKPRKFKSKKEFIAFLIVSVIAFFIYQSSMQIEYKKLESYQDTISIINVGQGDSALIQSGDEFCLIDAGKSSEGEDIYQYLKYRNVQEIELLVISHFHADHTTQILEILDNIQVNAILIPNLTEKNIPTTRFFERFMAKVEELNIDLYTAYQGFEYKVGTGVVKVLMDTPDTTDTNDTSICMTFTQDDFIYLTTGDANAGVEKELANYTPKVTLWAVGHHGSRGSNTTELMQAARPELGIISCGKDNEYGHPHSEAVQRMNDNFIPYLVTYEEGTIVYSIKDKAVLKQED